MKTEIKRRKVLKKWVRLTLLIIIIVVFFASFSLIKSSFKTPEVAPIEYSYNVKQNVDYKVYLYDNSFIEEEYLGPNEMYMADLIERINILFDYNYSGSKVVPVKYEYDIKGMINGSYQLAETGDNKIWNKEYVLLNPQTGEISDTNNINITESLDIDYAFYDNIVSSFRKELKISISATFDVIMTVNIYGTNDLEGKLIETKKMVVSIPLNSQVFKIEDDYEQKFNRNITPKIEQEESVDRKKLVCGILVGVVGIIIFLGLYEKIFNIKKKNPYNIKLAKILKNYGDIIVEVVNPNDEEGLNIVEVKNFNEMVDLEEELRIPIIFYETIDQYEGEFTIIHGNILYKYILDNEFENKKQ